MLMGHTEYMLMRHTEYVLCKSFLCDPEDNGSMTTFGRHVENFYLLIMRQIGKFLEDGEAP